MRSVVSMVGGVAVVVALLAAPTALAQDGTEQLRKAIDLFEKQNYVASQEALLQVDREALSEPEREVLDDLLDEVKQAIPAHAKAAQDMAAAEAAYEAGEWEQAEALYRAVELNQYALRSDQVRAVDQRGRIAEKRRLAEAAKPSDTVEGTVVTETVVVEEGEGADEETVVIEETTIEVEPVEPADPTEAHTPQLPRRLTPTDELRLRDELLWQRAVAKAEAQMARAREAMAAHDYLAARKALDTALQVIESASHYAEPVSKYASARQAVIELRDNMEREQAEYQAKVAAQEREEIAERLKERKRLLEQQKREKIQQLFRSAEQLRREQRFGEAAEVLREILRLDPANAKARYQLDWAVDFQSYAEQAEWQRNVYTQQRSALVKADEALIPWDVDVMYPRNWFELTAQRTALGIGQGEELEDRKLAQVIENTIIPDVRFEETPFDQVMDFLREFAEINIEPDWRDLEDNGIERDAPVTVRLDRLNFKTVLDVVLDQVGGDVQLAYSVGDGLLRIATKDKLDQNKLILIYDIRDLLVRVPRAERDSDFDVSQGMGGRGGGRGGGGGGGGLFGRGGNRDTGDDYDDENNEVQVQQIIDIIRQSIERDSWQETGGGDASIRHLSGQLIIYNTSSAHKQVANLLKQLRKTRALQVSVETRFLNVTANFLEQFGVDLDFVFNSGSAGYDRALGADGNVLTDPSTGAPILIDRRYSRIGSYAQPPAFGLPFTPGAVPQQPYGNAAFVPPRGGVSPHVSEMTPISAQQGSLSLVDPSALNTNVPGSWAQRSGLNPALNIAGSFLDNIQVDFLIRATQANSRSSIVQAPRLVLFNGQASRIQVGRSRSYVASLEPRLAEGAVGFEPEEDVVESGVNMWVEGTISADRKYVTLTLNVGQRDEPTFERFEVQRASGNSPGSFILLPDFTFAQLETTVSVPDGGTVLLGGLKQVGEVEVEAGVPILSKIPVLKRAFTNQTSVKDTRTLLILVKTKIIIQEEAEEEAFPAFSRTPA